MKSILSLVLIAATIAITGCTQDEKQMAGTGIGAVAGGAIGHAVSGGSTAATIGGAAVGGIVGYQATKY